MAKSQLLSYIDRLAPRSKSLSLVLIKEMFHVLPTVHNAMLNYLVRVKYELFYASLTSWLLYNNSTVRYSFSCKRVIS